MTKAELLALLATDPEVRVALREAVSPEDMVRIAIVDGVEVAVLPVLPAKRGPGWLTRAPHEKVPLAISWDAFRSINAPQEKVTE
jgi:hypothetical protein